MRQLFAFSLLILLSCGMNNSKTIDIVTQDTNEIDAIKKVLTIKRPS